EARREQKRVHDLRRGVAQISTDARDVPRTPQAGLEPEHRERRAGLPDLVADRPGVVNAADHRLESRRQAPDEIEHHLFGAADHEGMGQIHDTRTLACPPSRRWRFGASAEARDEVSRAWAEKARAPPIAHAACAR